jgi:hypothetical protein
MYLFLLKLRERIREEDPYERLMRFVVPMLLPFIMILAMMYPLSYAGNLALENPEVIWANPFRAGIIGYPLAFYFVFYPIWNVRTCLKAFI